jgi:hypothetical protein
MFSLPRIWFVGYHSKFMRSLIALAPVCSRSCGAFAQDRAYAWEQAVFHNSKTRGNFGACDPARRWRGQPEPVPLA